MEGETRVKVTPGAGPGSQTKKSHEQGEISEEINSSMWFSLHPYYNVSLL